MFEDDDRPRRQLAHTIGEKLDDLSARDLDERVALLRAEIERLETAKLQKQSARDVAGSVFRT